MKKILISEKTRKGSFAVFFVLAKAGPKAGWLGWRCGPAGKQNTHRHHTSAPQTGYMYKTKNVIAYGHIHHNIYINMLLLIVNIDIYCTIYNTQADITITQNKQHV